MIDNPICSECNVRKKSKFDSLSRNDLIDLSINKTCTFYKKGQTIFYEGKRPNGIFCLHYGKVKIYKNGYNGKEQIVRFATPGQLIGIRSLLGGVDYSASATTLEDSLICFISKQNFLHLLNKYPRISEQLMCELSQLLLEAEEKIISLAQKPVRERLAESLIILNKVYNADKSINNYTLTLSREDLANIVGTATETVIRLLSDFKDEKLISTQGRKIMLLDIRGLKKVGRILHDHPF